MNPQYKFILFLILLPLLSTGQQTPLEKSEYSSLTSYESLSVYIHELDAKHEILKVKSIGKSVEERNIYTLTFSQNDMKANSKKTKVLLFAQQHGNEQSGKEGMLLLARTLVSPEYRYLLNRLDIVLIPQVNPDGAEINRRRNANNMDLNRNHLIMTEPETQTLHHLIDSIQFDVTMDVHEYSPYGASWKNFGYRKNSDVTLGTCTNINISDKLRRYSDSIVSPYILSDLRQHGFSAFTYCPGGPPNTDYIRHSTFDYNDGRQSPGIQGTLSLIQEGMNGQDNYADNIKWRSESQMQGMLALLKFIYSNNVEIKKIIGEERKALLKKLKNGITSIQMKHVSNGSILKLPVFCYKTQKDTNIVIDNYRPVVQSVLSVTNPEAYLIPKSDQLLTTWLKHRGIVYTDFKIKNNTVINQYHIERLDSIDFEGDMIINPFVNQLKTNISNPTEYYYVPVVQIKGSMLIQALEPQSMTSLGTYDQFAYLIHKYKRYPVLRVERNIKNKSKQ